MEPFPLRGQRNPSVFPIQDIRRSGDGGKTTELEARSSKLED
jgi:hypothetical protein